MKNIFRGIVLYGIGLLLFTANLSANTRILEFGENLNFGNINVGESKTQELTLYNRGDSNLTIFELRFHNSLQGVYSGNFSGVIPPHGEKNVTITFRPEIESLYQGLVYIESDKTNSGDRDRVLTGMGVDMDASIETKILKFGNSLNFGEVKIGESVIKTLTLYNRGNSVLNIYNLRFHENLKGVFSGEFSGEILPHGEKHINITFTPQAKSSSVGLVYVESDRTNSSSDRTQLLRGVGVLLENPTDTVKPIITLVGDTTITLTKGTLYSDMGATANDNIDGDITSDINMTSTLNSSVVGTYSIKYNVTDSSGNIADEVTRVITVVDTEEVNLTRGLMAHYEFEGNAQDSSGNENHGVEHGAINYVDGVIGQSASFDGIDDYIRIANKNPNSFKEFSISLYLLPKGKGGSVLNNSSRNGVQGRGFGLNLNDENGLVIPEETEGDYLWFGALFDENWIGNEDTSLKTKIDKDSFIHVCAVYSNGDEKLYVDGQLKASHHVEHKFDLGNYDFLIGTYFFNDATSIVADIYNRAFLGQMDDLRFYNRALNPAEVTELHKMGKKSKNENRLILKYTEQFNDFTPTNGDWISAGFPLPQRLSLSDAEDGYVWDSNGDGSYQSASYLNKFKLPWDKEFKVEFRLKQPIDNSLNYWLYLTLSINTSPFISDENRGQKEARITISGSSADRHEPNEVSANVQGNDKNRRFEANYNDGQWHTYTIHHKINDAGAREIDILIDGNSFHKEVNTRYLENKDFYINIDGRSNKLDNYLDYIKVYLEEGASLIQ